MVKILMRYENEAEKIKIIEILAKGAKLIGKPSDPYKSGKYYRCYVNIE